MLCVPLLIEGAAVPWVRGSVVLTIPLPTAELGAVSKLQRFPLPTCGSGGRSIFGV